MDTLPEPGSVWRHYNGALYSVVMLTNVKSTRPQYPLTIVYQGENGETWSRPFSDWHRSMTLVR